MECREEQLAKLQKTNIDPEVHPYEQILSTELRELFETSEMALICQKNSINDYDFFKFKVALHQKDVKVKVHGKKIITEALKDTKFRSLLPVLNVSSCMLFGSPSSVGHILKVLKKTPQMLLLAGTMSDRILSKNELVEYSKLPDLQTTRAQFAATLNAAGGQILNNLQAHQSNLCYMLDAHAKALGDAASPKLDTPDDASFTGAETKTE